MKKFLLSLLIILTLIGNVVLTSCKKSTEEPEPPQITLSFAEENYTVERYSTKTLGVNYNGSETIVYTVEDQSVLSVNNGVALGVKAGTTKVTATAGEKTAQCTVTVKATINYFALNISQTELELSVGNQKTISLSLNDGNGKKVPDNFVEFSMTSNNDCVSTANNVITANKLGESIVTVKAVCVGQIIEETIKVVIKENSSISFNKTSIELCSNPNVTELKNSEQLEVFVYEDGEMLENPQVEYIVENAAVAQVSTTGLLTSISQGTTKVYAKFITKNNTTITTELMVDVQTPKLTTPDVNSFVIDKDGVLSWDAVPGAVGYTLLINNKTTVEVTSNSSTAFVEGVVSVKAKGDGTLYLDGEYSETLTHFNLPDNYLAAFSSEGYELLVSEFNNMPLKSVKYLPTHEFGGQVEENVLEITMYQVETSGGFVLKLPKPAGSNKIELKMRCELIKCEEAGDAQSDWGTLASTQVRFCIPGTITNLTSWYAVEKDNSWKTYVLDYSTFSGLTDEIVVKNTGNKNNRLYRWYISYVKLV